MVRLLDACVQTLRQQGKNRMYIDAVKGGDAGFQSIGTRGSLLCLLLPEPIFGRPLTFGQVSTNGRATETYGGTRDIIEAPSYPYHDQRT